MYSFDSDTVTGILRGSKVLVQRVQAVEPSARWVSTIVVEELVGGQLGQINSSRSRRRPVEREARFLADLIKSLAAFQILPYTDEAEQLYQSWTAKQKRVGPNDGRIAASAILAGFTVITCNGKDFSTIPSLNWQDWSQP